MYLCDNGAFFTIAVLLAGVSSAPSKPPLNEIQTSKEAATTSSSRGEDAPSLSVRLDQSGNLTASCALPTAAAAVQTELQSCTLHIANLDTNGALGLFNNPLKPSDAACTFDMSDLPPPETRNRLTFMCRIKYRTCGKAAAEKTEQARSADFCGGNPRNAVVNQRESLVAFVDYDPAVNFSIVLDSKGSSLVVTAPTRNDTQHTQGPPKTANATKPSHTIYVTGEKCSTTCTPNAARDVAPITYAVGFASRAGYRNECKKPSGERTLPPPPPPPDADDSHTCVSAEEHGEFSKLTFGKFTPSVYYKLVGV